MCAQYCISFADVEKAHLNIQDSVHLTPVLTSSILNQIAGRNLFFKCELFQKTGSFKIRGALNAIRGLIPDTLEGKPKAVVTHSSGNHGQALTYAAKLEGIPAYIVVPQTAPNCKKLAIQAYGASIVYSEPSDEVKRALNTSVTYLHLTHYLPLIGRFLLIWPAYLSIYPSIYQSINHLSLLDIISLSLM